MKKLNSSEIDRLYSFTRQHYVIYYDVQTELVDHLANGIESQWKENPEIPFEEALQREFKKFGIYGFSDVVEKREQAMSKKYTKLICSEFVLVLKRPKVVLGLLFIFGLSTFILKWENGNEFFLTILFIAFSFLLIIVGRRAVKRRRAKEGKQLYLLETIIYNTGGYFSLVWIPFQLMNFMDAVESGWMNWLMASLITFCALTSYVCFYRLPKKKDEILKKVYPEMKYS